MLSWMITFFDFGYCRCLVRIWGIGRIFSLDRAIPGGIVRCSVGHNFGLQRNYRTSSPYTTGSLEPISNCGL